MWRCFILFVVWGGIASGVHADQRLWHLAPSELIGFDARGWSPADLKLKNCETRNENRSVCEYALFATADVYAFADKIDGTINSISIRCEFTSCSDETFLAFSVYLMRAANADSDDVLTVLLESALAKTMVIFDDQILMAYKNNNSYVLIIKQNP